MGLWTCNFLSYPDYSNKPFAWFFNGRKYKGKDNINTRGKDTKTKKEQTYRVIPIQSIVEGKISMPSHEEFQNLLTFDDGFSQQATSYQGERYNDMRYGFNRVPKNIPYDHNRLRLQVPIENCDYVNANKISPASDDPTYDELIYTSHQPFKSIDWVVGQNPLPRTMGHHFRLIHESRFDSVIGFMDNPSETLFESGNTYEYNGLKVEVLSRHSLRKYLLRTDIMLSSNSIAEYHDKHQTSYFEFVNWPNEQISGIEHIDELLSALCAIRTEIDTKRTKGKVFVHDSRGGVTGAAVFLIMYELMDQIDSSFTEDNRMKKGASDIDLFAIINRLRKDRAMMI